MTRKPEPAPPPTRSRVLSAQLLYPVRRGQGPLLSVTSPAAPAVAVPLRPPLRPDHAAHSPAPPWPTGATPAPTARNADAAPGLSLRQVLSLLLLLPRHGCGLCPAGPTATLKVLGPSRNLLPQHPSSSWPLLPPALALLLARPPPSLSLQPGPAPPRASSPPRPLPATADTPPPPLTRQCCARPPQLLCGTGAAPRLLGRAAGVLRVRWLPAPTPAPAGQGCAAPSAPATAAPDPASSPTCTPSIASLPRRAGRAVRALLLASACATPVLPPPPRRRSPSALGNPSRCLPLAAATLSPAPPRRHLRPGGSPRLWQTQPAQDAPPRRAALLCVRAAPLQTIWHAVSCLAALGRRSPLAQCRCCAPHLRPRPTEDAKNAKDAPPSRAVIRRALHSPPGQLACRQPLLSPHPPASRSRLFTSLLSSPRCPPPQAARSCSAGAAPLVLGRAARVLSPRGHAASLRTRQLRRRFAARSASASPHPPHCPLRPLAVPVLCLTRLR
jgi:hypothetical protein